MSRRKYIVGAVAVVVVMAVAAIGVPAGWYGSRVSPVVSQPSTAAPVVPATVAETPAVTELEQPTTRVWMTVPPQSVNGKKTESKREKTAKKKQLSTRRLQLLRLQVQQ